MAKETGHFEVACAQHCGIHHYKMKGDIRVLTPEDYDAWYLEAAENAKVKFDPDDADALRVGSPDREVRTIDAIDRREMRAKAVVDARVVAFTEEVQVVLGNQGARRADHRFSSQ